MSLTTVTIFGTNRDGVDAFAEDGREICERRGIGFKGPLNLQGLRCAQMVEYFGLDKSNDWTYEDVPEWFSDIDLDEVEEDIIRSAASETSNEEQFIVFGRFIQIREDDVAAKFLKTTIPEDVFLRIGVDIEEIPEPKGNIPHSYDPAIDYVTDMDYDAHY